MSLQRGDVVLATLPFVTRPGFKLRPVLVMQRVDEALKESLGLS